MPWVWQEVSVVPKDRKVLLGVLAISYAVSVLGREAMRNTLLLVVSDCAAL